MTAQIIQFGKPATAARSTDFIAGYMDAVRDTAERRAKPQATTATTATAKNRRLRDERWAAWRKADATTHYWRAPRLSLRSFHRDP